jgi:hypothetical protein
MVFPLKSWLVASRSVVLVAGCGRIVVICRCCVWHCSGDRSRHEVVTTFRRGLPILENHAGMGSATS